MSQDYITINPDTREITIPDSEVVFGVYNDKNVERKYFKCPKIVGDNIDLSECYIFINYVTADGKYGRYHCDDVEIDGDDVTFSWLLSSNVFDYNKKSKIKFAVQASKLDEEGKLVNVFGTQSAKGTTYATIQSGEVIEEEYADIILELLTKVDNVADKAWVTEQIEEALRSIPNAEEVSY